VRSLSTGRAAERQDAIARSIGGDVYAHLHVHGPHPRALHALRLPRPARALDGRRV